MTEREGATLREREREAGKPAIEVEGGGGAGHGQRDQEIDSCGEKGKETEERERD